MYVVGEVLTAWVADCWVLYVFESDPLVELVETCVVGMAGEGLVKTLVRGRSVFWLMNCVCVINNWIGSEVGMTRKVE